MTFTHSPTEHTPGDCTHSFTSTGENTTSRLINKKHDLYNQRKLHAGSSVCVGVCLLALAVRALRVGLVSLITHTGVFPTGLLHAEATPTHTWSGLTHTWHRCKHTSSSNNDWLQVLNSPCAAVPHSGLWAGVSGPLRGYSEVSVSGPEQG